MATRRPIGRTVGVLPYLDRTASAPAPALTPAPALPRTADEGGAEYRHVRRE